ncbi:hypothetical protein [Acinetobacter junii]|uniref:hypothetical protein n=1 Tax=Acinetobacter junii TaxID=40215 RepID=UPI000F662428|nr:hypothetical protein [Acinetobacter junii]RSE30790.1 hypothetical protein EGT62_14845 [Acinetobacter junii]
MKINISFDWAFITSIFTFFLYWCGYWYYSGYASFYNYNLDAFDVPLAPLILGGFLVGIKYVIYLLITLISLSFLISIDKKQWDFFITKSFLIVLNIYLLFYYLFEYLAKNSFTNNYWNMFKIKLKSGFRVIKPKLRGTVRLDTLLGLKVQRFFKKHKLTNEDIKEKIFGDPNPVVATSFEFSMLLHYLFIILLMIGLFSIFYVGKEQSNEGYKKAELEFSKFTKMNEVRIKDDSGLKFKITGLCFKGFCLITDKEKNVKLHEMKDAIIHNSTTKPK